MWASPAMPLCRLASPSFPECPSYPSPSSLLTPSTTAQDITTRVKTSSRLLRGLSQWHPPCQWARVVFLAVCVVCHLDVHPKG
ncbi:hypothetical protein FIBSPDRAFT_497964 [Athelia psychrophila]|uniref:Uncharacterized protein n=1 Tax=Athelia psychrophila TaxID=1759441 RepID=A0A166KF44_9AGAM|nr:hypothetical protein FIBSPDRAFT_497964 [Fibularhizoctonia sp. CBS 109695]